MKHLRHINQTMAKMKQWYTLQNKNHVYIVNTEQANEQEKTQENNNFLQVLDP